NEPFRATMCASNGAQLIVLRWVSPDTKDAAAPTLYHSAGSAPTPKTPPPQRSIIPQGQPCSTPSTATKTHSRTTHNSWSQNHSSCTGANTIGTKCQPAPSASSNRENRQP